MFKVLKNSLSSYLNVLKKIKCTIDIYDTLSIGYYKNKNTSYHDMVNGHSEIYIQLFKLIYMVLKNRILSYLDDLIKLKFIIEIIETI